MTLDQVLTLRDNEDNLKALMSQISFHQIALTFMILTLGCGPKPPATISGREEAERDVSRGTLKLYLYGERTPAHETFAGLFAERCGGAVEYLGSASLTDAEDHRIQEYNRYVLQELSRRHGAKAVPTLCDRSGLGIDQIIPKRPLPER